MALAREAEADEATEAHHGHTTEHPDHRAQPSLRRRSGPGLDRRGSGGRGDLQPDLDLTLSCAERHALLDAASVARLGAKHMLSGIELEGSRACLRRRRVDAHFQPAGGLTAIERDDHHRGGGRDQSSERGLALGAYQLGAHRVGADRVALLGGAQLLAF